MSPYFLACSSKPAILDSSSLILLSISSFFEANLPWLTNVYSIMPKEGGHLTATSNFKSSMANCRVLLMHAFSSKYLGKEFTDDNQLVETSIVYNYRGNQLWHWLEEFRPDMLDSIGAEVNELEVGVVDQQVAVKCRQFIRPQAQNPKGREGLEVVAFHCSQLGLGNAEGFQVGERFFNILWYRVKRGVLDVERFDVLAGLALDVVLRHALHRLIALRHFESSHCTSISFIENDPILDRVDALKYHRVILVGEERHQDAHLYNPLPTD